MFRGFVCLSGPATLQIINTETGDLDGGSGAGNQFLPKIFSGGGRNRGQEGEVT